MIQKVGDSGLINRDEQGTARQRGNGIVEIAGIKVYKSMNIPFHGKYGVNYTSAGKTVDNTGSFVEADLEDASDATTGINNTGGYGTAAEVASTSCGLIFQKEAAACVEAIAPQVQTTSGDVSVIYQGDVILGRLAMGADYLNPAAAVELHTTNSPGSAF